MVNPVNQHLSTVPAAAPAVLPAMNKQTLRAYLLNPALDINSAQACANAPKFNERKFRAALQALIREKGLKADLITAKVLPAPVVALLVEKIGF